MAIVVEEFKANCDRLLGLVSTKKSEEFEIPSEWMTKQAVINDIPSFILNVQAIALGTRGVSCSVHIG